MAVETCSMVSSCCTRTLLATDHVYLECKLAYPGDSCSVLPGMNRAQDSHTRLVS